MTKSKATTTPTDSKDRESKETTSSDDKERRDRRDKLIEIRKEEIESKERKAEAWNYRDLWIRQRDTEREDTKYKEVARKKAEEYQRIIIEEERKLDKLKKLRKRLENKERTENLNQKEEK